MAWKERPGEQVPKQAQPRRAGRTADLDCVRARVSLGLAILNGAFEITSTRSSLHATVSQRDALEAKHLTRSLRSQTLPCCFHLSALPLIPTTIIRGQLSFQPTLVSKILGNCSIVANNTSRGSYVDCVSSQLAALASDSSQRCVQQASQTALHTNENIERDRKSVV